MVAASAQLGLGVTNRISFPATRPKLRTAMEAEAGRRHQQRWRWRDTSVFAHQSFKMARSVLCYYVKRLDHWMRLQPIGKRLCFRHFRRICRIFFGGWNEIPWKRTQSRIGFFFLDLVSEFSLCLRLFISLFSDKIVHDEQRAKWANATAPEVCHFRTFI